MVTRESKVVAFESVQVKQKDSSRRADMTRLVAECRSLFSERTADLLQALFSRIDDELFKLSDKAENSNLQTIYFDSMRYVRRERDTIESHFAQSLQAGYDDFWRNRPVQFVTQQAPAAELNEDSFELVENADLEEGLAINTMIGKGNNLFHQELFGLNRRFGALLNRDEIPVDSNPVAPAAVCRAFEEAIKPHDLELKVKLLIYKLFDRHMLSAFGPVYHELNTYLIGEGVLPTIPRAVKRQPVSDLAEPGATAQKISRALEEAEAGDNEAYAEAFQAMQSLLDGWRAQLGLPSHASAMPGAVVFEPAEVLNALSVLQHPGQWTGGDAFTSGESLKVFVANQLGKLQPGGQNRPLGRLEEDIIDMVAMIFDFILEDRNLPDAVKALIARLQIPVVKVAILDKAFFARRSHPARVLLNSLAQAGIGLDGVDSTSQNPTFKKIEEVVGRVLSDFDQDVELFAELLEDFALFMDKDEQRSHVMEERTRQATQSREQMRLAKKQVAYEIAAKLRGREVPEAALSFLYNAWKDVMVLAWLRRDKEPEQWSRALELVDTLILTAVPPADARVRQEIVHAIPALLQGIREGLETISHDPSVTSQALKELEAMHVACLKAQPGGEVAEAARPAPPSSVVIRDLELAEAIQEIKSNLPDIDDFGLDDLVVGGFGETILLDKLPKSQDEPADEYGIQAEAMPIGEWLEFSEGEQAPWRAKLSWKSHVTNLYVFVNRKGVKAAEMSMADLAGRLRAGQARIIEGAGVPLMDRALAALMQTLKNPGKKSDAPD